MRYIWISCLSLLVAGAVAGSAAAHAARPFAGVVVGSRHSTLLVAAPSGAVRAVRGRAAVGTRVRLDGAKVDVVGQAQSVPVQGVVSAVAAGSVTLTVGGQPLTLTLPAGLTLPASLIGTTVTLNLTFDDGVANANPRHDDGDDDEVATTTTTTPTTTTTTTTPVPIPTHTERHGGHGDGGGDD